MNDKYARFTDIGFDDFRRFAADERLSQYEKIGFPDEYRKGFEEAIFEDILSKLPILDSENKLIFDIGPGCSELPRLLIEHCTKHKHDLTLVDSAEMLELLPDSTGTRKVPAYFPGCASVIDENEGEVDAIICYSVLHYVAWESNLWSFLDDALRLLAPGGRMLIGDIPNISKRKRFFASETGRKFHKAFMQTTSEPDVEFNCLEPGNIDDGIVLAIIMRVRIAGFDAYLLPQPDSLPMANRREDILVCRP